MKSYQYEVVLHELSKELGSEWGRRQLETLADAIEMLQHDTEDSKGNMDSLLWDPFIPRTPLKLDSEVRGAVWLRPERQNQVFLSPSSLVFIFSFVSMTELLRFRRLNVTACTVIDELICRRLQIQRLKSGGHVHGSISCECSKDTKKTVSNRRRPKQKTNMLHGSMNLSSHGLPSQFLYCPPTEGMFRCPTLSKNKQSPMLPHE